MVINGYRLNSELQNANSGFSKWAFATRGGKQYFIKELINPVYPVDGGVMPVALFQQKREFCQQYELKFREFFGEINRVSRGNLVRINDFFRYGSKYYVVTEKVEGKTLSADYISTLSDEKKKLLLKTAAQCFMDLHSAGIVHFDVKLSNILIKVTSNNNLSAKLIDFDSGFFKKDIPKGDDLGGDLTYLAPEIFLAMCGEDVVPDEKADIFGLGLVFHQYYCGKLPHFDTNEYEYSYGASLDKKLFVAKELMPDEISNLISSMLDSDPAKRPSAAEIVAYLSKKEKAESAESLNVVNMQLVYTAFSGGTAFKRLINLSGNTLKYSNLITMETRSLDANLFRENEKVLTDTDKTALLKAINDFGLTSSLRPQGELTWNREQGNITCILTDGKVYELTETASREGVFEKVVTAVASFCRFPDYTPTHYEPTVPVNKEEPVKSTDSGWFSRAGDL